MSLIKFAKFLLLSGVLAATTACEEPSPPSTASATASVAAAAPTAIISAKPVVKQKTGPKPSHPCPEKSKGEGTLKSPCKASGAERAMVVQWSGKIKDEGPMFRVTNKTKLEILYGNIFIYFYDKAGKLLQVDVGGKKANYRSCAGRIFAGPMKAGEKAALYFSCAKKKHVPEGTTTIEAELKTVGFTGETSKSPDTYWRNADLTPKNRPKGGAR